MPKGKPYSDAEIRPETPWVIEHHLKAEHYDSPEWHCGAGIPNKNRGLRNRLIVDDAADSVTQIEQLPSETRKGRI